MSSKRFKIILHMEQFFHDHRSMARIFINEQVRTVGDLCRHISDVFKIQNFYLTCENQYLPPSEDIEVLQPDEKVWVKSNNFLLLQQDVFIESNDSNVNGKCKKTTSVKEKRRKIEVADDLDESFDDVPKKKKKKSKLDEVVDVDNSNIMSTFSELECEEISSLQMPKKVKKTKRVEIGQENTNREKEHKNNTEIFQQQNDTKKAVSQNSSINIIENKIIGLSTKNIIEKCDNRASEDKDDFFSLMSTSLQSKTEREKMSSLEVPKKSKKTRVETVQEKTYGEKKHKNKINIIENKIIGSSTKNTREECDSYANGIVKSFRNITEFPPNHTSTPVVNNNTDLEQKPLEKCEVIQNTTDNFDSTVHKFNNNVNGNNENGCLSTDVTNSCPENSFENFTKSIRPSMLKMSVGPFVEFLKQEEDCNVDDSFVTKRKRKRVRHRKRKTGSELKQDCESSVECKSTIISTPINNNSNKPKIHIRFDDNDDKDADVTTEESLIIKLDINGTESLQNGQTNIDINNAETVSDEQIKNCAEIKSFPPKIGNVLSFKILRISEMYTPEISSFIIGKVLDSKEENQEVTFEIIRGNEQFAEPEGKFSLECDTAEDENKENEKIDEVTISWINLIDIRLLSN